MYPLINICECFDHATYVIVTTSSQQQNILATYLLTSGYKYPIQSQSFQSSLIPDQMKTPPLSSDLVKSVNRVFELIVILSTFVTLSFSLQTPQLPLNMIDVIF